MRKAFKYRLSPTCKQAEKLQWTLDRCRELSNAALSERKDAYKMHQRTTVYQNEQGQCFIAQMEASMKVNDVSYYQQKRDIVDIKAIREEYKDIHSQVLQDVVNRIEKGMQAFFRRLREGQTPGFPRFKGRDRYDSFSYPQDGYSLTHDRRVCLSKIGSIKVKLHREIQGVIKTCTVKREVDAWYVVFSCEVATPTPLPVVGSEIGIDVGVTHFAALSDETFIESPRYYRKAQGDLAVAQQALSRKKRGSHRRKKAVKCVAKLHRKVKNQRADFHHKAARQLVNAHQVIVFEDLQLANLVKHAKPKQDEETGAYLPNGAAAKSGLTKSILDNGLGTFVQMVMSKAEEAGRQVYTVDPRYTSQVCSGCGKRGAKKDLSERVHTCIHCGLVLDRDTNAAKNILWAWKMPTEWERVRSSRSVEAPSF